MILLTPRLGDAGLKKLEQVDIPTVLMGHLEGTDFYSVDVDNQLAAQQGVQHLLELGHTQIACISNAPPSYAASPERVAGYKAALTSAATFATGAALPLLTVFIAPKSILVPAVFLASLAFLALLGAVGARLGGADVFRATTRVTFWGALAMAITAGIGGIFGTVV